MKLFHNLIKLRNNNNNMDVLKMLITIEHDSLLLNNN